jgi:hypothetical protein
LQNEEARKKEGSAKIFKDAKNDGDSASNEEDETDEPKNGNNED